jgi:serine/threonine-protein kinase
MLQIGEHIGRFRVLGLIGEGGIATVYRVEHATLQSVHALKLLHHTRGDMALRLLQEGRIQARLHHPNVVAVTDVIEIGGQTGLVMEFVEGSSLREVLDEGGLEREEALTLFQQLLSGVAAAHRAEVLHRDLKPANILLSVSQRGIVAKITDFGIAKVAQGDLDRAVTRAGSMLGTPGYMAPEQVEDSGRVDRRADVFALGCILYEMLTGDAPFLRNELFATLNATTKGDYVPLHERMPDLPPELHLAVARALEIDPDLRFSSCEEFAEAVYGEECALDPGEPASPVAGPAALDRAQRSSNPTLMPSDMHRLRSSIERSIERVRGPSSADTFPSATTASMPPVVALPPRPTPRALAPPPAEAPAPTPASPSSSPSLEAPAPRPKREPVRVPDEATLREEFDRLKPPPGKPEEGLVPALPISASDAASKANTIAGNLTLLFIRGGGFLARYVAGPAAVLLFFAWREANEGVQIVTVVREQQVAARTEMALTLSRQVQAVNEMAAVGADTVEMRKHVAAYDNAKTFEERLAAGDRLLDEMQRELADIKLQRGEITREQELKRRAIERQILSLSSQFREYRAQELRWAEQLDDPSAGFATALGMVDPVERPPID